MPESEPAPSVPLQTHVQYLFLDIVGFSDDSRTIEDQTSILDALNAIVSSSLRAFEVPAHYCLLLPTGDGLCVAVLDRPLPGVLETPGQVPLPWDVLIDVSLMLLRKIEEHNASVGEGAQKFKIRIGLNAHLDNLVSDVNRRHNLAGAGINTCQRVMSFGDGGHVLLADGYHSLVRARARFRDILKPYTVTLQGRSNPASIYQLLAASPGLNLEEPTVGALRKSERPGNSWPAPKIFP